MMGEKQRDAKATLDSSIIGGGTSGASAASHTPYNTKLNNSTRRRVMFRPYKEGSSKTREDLLSGTDKQDVADGGGDSSTTKPDEEFARKQLWVKNARAWDTPLWWCLLALTRLLLAFVQTSYIHPDEFHQSLQVRARDVLHIEGQKPWEFTSSTPLRSIVFSSFISLPYSVLRQLSPYASYYLDWTILTPTTLLVAPRLFVTLLSFIADFCVYKIARLCYIRPWQCMEVFASSYVMLVYATRTFSNTFELILMCVVLWRVSLSIVDSSKVIRKETIIQDLYETAEEMRDKVRLARIKSSLPAYNYVDSFVLSVVVTYGTFVRPTFIIYTFVPLAYWLQRGIVTKELNFWYFNMRCLSLLPGIICTFVVCVLADSFYYETLTFKEFLYGNVTANSFTVTPINFFLYNKKKENLAKHGEHPHYLHVLVNLPLLHGVLAFVGLYYTSLFVSSLFSAGRITRKPKVYSLASMLLLSFIVPVIVLSLVPHQEARFLLPTLPCLILLHSDKVSLHNAFRLRFTKNFLFLMWHTWNAFCVLFFGFLHQGAVTKAMISVHDYVQNQPETFGTPLHVYFSHMYTPPTFLLMRRIDVIASTGEGKKFKVPRSIFSHHLSGSTSMETMNVLLYNRLSFNSSSSTNLNQTLFSPIQYNTPTILTPTNGSQNVENIDSLSSSSNNDLVSSINSMDAAEEALVPDLEVLLCLPGSIAALLEKGNMNHLKFQLLERLPLHVTLEDIPDFTIYREEITPYCNEGCAARKKLSMFSLEIYKVMLPKFGEEEINNMDEEESNYDEEEEEEEDTWLED